MTIYIDTLTGPKVVDPKPEVEPDPADMAEAEALLERLLAEAAGRGTLPA